MDDEHKEVPPYRDTEFGRIYRPLSEGKQALVLILSFLAALFLGSPVASLSAVASETARSFLHVPYVLVFFSGYALWVARLHALGFSLFGWALVRIFWGLIVRRRLPRGAADMLPDRRRLEEAGVRAQQAGGSFSLVGFGWALMFGFIYFWVESPSSVRAAALVSGSILAWGWGLSRLATRGYLPFMESE